MRVLSRFALVAVTLVLSATPLLADHLNAECALSLVASQPPASNFHLSPHGVFRSGNQVFVLRGQTLTTYTVTELGDLTVAREDFIGSLGARETEGGVAFSNGFLFVSSEAGLEIYDLRGVRAGGTAPLLVSRTPGLHYRRLAVNGNTLAATFPVMDLPCYPIGFSQSCFNVIDIYNVANLNLPTRTATISTLFPGNFSYLQGINDIGFNFGYLIAVGEGGTASFNVNNPMQPFLVGNTGRGGKFLVSNGGNLVGVGTDGSVAVYVFNTAGAFVPFTIYHVANSLTIDRSNPIAFSRNAWFDDPNGRLVTMVNEINPLTLKPSRTIAFDIFDFTVPMFEGSNERGYEQITYLNPDEVKYNPVTVGPYVYVIGEMSGLQSWGACNVVTGRIEWDGTQALPCGGTELHGWVTGTQKIANVEIFLDNGSLGAATIGGVPRHDVSSTTPVFTWRLNVNLDATPRGEHILRAVGTDSTGTRRQFASQRVFFQGPPNNCFNRRRQSTKGF